MKKWKEAVSVLIVTVVICCGVCGRIHAGEFGGFDVDIGTEEDIFDNWEETSETEIPEPELKPEVAEPKPEATEPKPESTESKPRPEAAEQKPESAESKPRPEAAEQKPGSTESKPRPEAAEPKSESAESKPRPEAAEPKPESTESKPRPEAAEPKSEPAELQPKPTEPKKEIMDPKPTEPRKEITEPESVEPKSEALDSGMKAAGQKKKKKKKTKNGSRNASKSTALGVVLAASGMSKISPELNFYNKNDENGKKKENKTKYNNCNVRFEHSEIIDINEYPEIKMVRTADEQDITVLSLRVDGEEIFWHQKGDILIFDQPVTKKNATVELVVAVDGMQIVKMPVWTI